ncbi:MAG TPA: GAF domain-containing protein, partial [Phycisphaerae bacterium]|nr:GAF domain-containing protein [Phycisphaerae bacterium]
MAKPKHKPRRPTGSEGEIRELALLADLAAPLSDVEDQETLKRKVLEGALKIFRCESGAVALWEEEGRLGTVGPSAGRAEHLTPEDLLSAEPVLQVVLREGRPLVLDDPGLTLGPALDGWRGLAVAPIARGTRPLGFLLVGDRRGDEPFTQRDVALL